MRIMVLSSYAPTLLFFREDMMTAMVAKGHEVIAVAPESEDEWAPKFGDLKIKYVSISSVERTGTNPIKDIFGFANILRVIRKVKPDKVFAYQAKTIVYGCLAAKLAQVDEIYAMVGGLGSIFRNKETKKIVRDILKLEYKMAFGCCDKIFVQNGDDRNQIVNAGLVRNEKVTMVNGSGVNMEKFQEKPVPEKPVFLFVGRILRDKGVYEYVEAARLVKRKYPEAEVQIVGYFDTNPTAIREEEIAKYVDDGVIQYLGPTDDVRPYLEKCSVFVLPSHHEGTPKSVLEAMSTGRPIITTDAPGCRETVVNGKNGFLVQVGNAGELAEKMIWMIEHRDEAHTMGQESLALCKQKFDVNKVNDVLLSTMNI